MFKVCDGLKNLELPSKQDHVEDLFSVCDVNQDGVIHYAQFEALAMHRRYVCAGGEAFPLVPAQAPSRANHGLFRKPLAPQGAFNILS